MRQIFSNAKANFHLNCWSRITFKISLSLSFNEARTMKLFTYLRLQLETLGISPIKNDHRYVRNGAHLFFVGHILITALIYFIFEAKTIPEFVDSIYIFITAVTNVFSFVVFILYRSNIFQLIEKLEKAIEQRTQQAIYDKLNVKIESFSKKFQFVFAQCTSVGVVMPVFLTSLFLYSTTDLQNEAFQLPFLTSLVTRNALNIDSCWS